MKLPVLALAVAVLMQQVGSRPAIDIQKATPETIPATQVFEAIRLLTSYADVALPLEDVIKGERTWLGTVIAASTLTFEPGSKLVFAPSVGDRTDRFVFVLAPVGKAPPGEMGSVDRGDGKDGPDGQPGNPGYPGRSAPTIYLVVNRKTR